MTRISEKELLERLSRCAKIIASEEVADYILNHPQPKAAAKMLHDIMLLDEFGLALPERYVHRIRESAEKLWELRTQFARYEERTLFFSLPGGRFLLTNCFRKKSGKVPQSEIRKAESILKKYLQTLREGK